MRQKQVGGRCDNHYLLPADRSDLGWAFYLHPLPRIFPTARGGTRSYGPHFTEEDAEAPSGAMTCLEHGFDPRTLGAKVIGTLTSECLC